MHIRVQCVVTFPGEKIFLIVYKHHLQYSYVALYVLKVVGDTFFYQIIIECYAKIHL